MKSHQFTFSPNKGWSHFGDTSFKPDLLLAFGSGKECNGEILVKWWQENFPLAKLLGCSTAGEIEGTTVLSGTIVVTAIKFEKTKLELCSLDFDSSEDSEDVGQKLASLLPHEGLKHCFVLSDGLNINGTRLVNGLSKALPEGILITGGLAGDGKRFELTQICTNESYGPNKVAVLGFYGDNIDIRSASFGGWDVFGPERLITHAENNVLYELDGQSALALYKDYLGEHAKELPSSGLLFPLKVTTNEGKEFVRTLLAIENETGAMTFAGDIPQGAHAQLMRANFERLIDGASHAAELALDKTPPELAILISCVGRRLVLGQRIEEEVEAVSEIFQNKTQLCGFYSYGEICPLLDEVGCTLHNQTMTITTFTEDLQR